MKHFFSTFIMMLTVLFTYCKKNEVKPVPTVLPSDEVDHMPAGKSLHVKYIGQFFGNHNQVGLRL